MDTELLVEQKTDGQRLIEQLERDGFPVSVAFWVRTSEDGLWHLDIASPAVKDQRSVEPLRRLYAALDKVSSPWVTLVNVTLLPEQDSIARAAIEMRDRYPTPLPINRTERLGNLTIYQAYIYPPIAAPRLSFTVSCRRKGNTNNWVATTKRGRVLKDLQVKGAVAFSTARWGEESEADPSCALVSVLVELDPRFDDPAFLDHPDLKRITADQARRMADEMFRSHHPDAVIEPEIGEEALGRSSVA
jgi:hypothetical protein